MLIHPLITEKSSLLALQRKYVFRVDQAENKIEIAKEVEAKYNVKVNEVNIIWTKSKKRRLGKIEGKRGGFKKAIVTLKEGQKIEI